MWWCIQHGWSSNVYNQDWIHLTYWYGQEFQLADDDTIKAIKIIGGSLIAVFELTKIIKCFMFLKLQEKNEILSKKERSFQQVKERQYTRNLWWHNICPNYWTVTGALPESSLDNWVVSQELRDGILNGRVDSRVRGQAIGVQTQMRSFNFFFGIQIGVLVIQTTHRLFYDTHIFTDVARNNEFGRAGSNRDLFCIVSANVA